MALLAFAGSLQAQQHIERGVRPAEKLTIFPTTASWNELVKLNESFTQLGGAALEQAPSLALETPIIELGPPTSHVLPSGSDIPPQAITPCSVNTGSTASFDSQLDVPDSNLISYIPPDVAGAVGPGHLMTMLNNLVLIQDRAGASISAVDLSAFWSPVAGASLTYPRVYFDSISDRFIATVRSNTGGAMRILLAASATDDPTGVWSFYAITADPGALNFPDWVVTGYNATWIAITANMFTVATSASVGAKLWVVDQSTVGGVLTVTVFPNSFTAAVHGSGGTSVHPMRALDTSTPDLWMVSNGFTSGGVFLLQLTRMSGTGAAPVLSGIAGSPFGGTTSFCFVTTNFSGTQRNMAQVGDARFISAFSIRTASVAWRNNKLWVAHSGGLPGPSSNATPTSTGVVWHQLDPTLPFPASSGAPGSMLVQSGAITGPPTNTFAGYPSLAVNCGDDVIVGFSYGDVTINPQASYAIRLGSDPLNSMGPMTTLKTGDSSYWKNFGIGTTAQWGRYTSSAVDPLDETTLWTLQEYAGLRVGVADNDSRWATRWGRVGTCGVPTTITSQPVGLLVCLPDPAVFSVTATSGPLTYQWRKNGAPILGETSSTLSFASTVSSDGGIYDVVIDDGCSLVVSAPAALTFSGPVVALQPVDVTTAVGNPASFTVSATGTGTILYQWRRNGVPISGANSSTYSIASVTGADYGTYDCELEDDCGPVLSGSAKLKPVTSSGKTLPGSLSFHIFEGPSSTTACAGDNVTLSVTAYPAGATFVWRKNNVAIVPAETNPTLNFPSVATADAGAYDVVVTHNSQTRTSDDAILTVDDRPVITSNPTGTTAQINDTVSFTVAATGAGTLTYQWQLKSGPFTPFVNVDGAVEATYTIDQVKASDAGTYRCRVTNHCGSRNSGTAILSISF